MKEVHVWLYGTHNPLIFEFVEEVYETRKVIVIVQEDRYKTTTTKIYKQALLYYQTIEQR